MNHSQPYMDVHSHMSSAQPYPSQAATSGTMSHYPYQHQPPVLQPASTYAPVTYQQYAYPNSVTSPPSAHAPPASSLSGQMPTQLLPLPQVSATSNHSSAAPSGYGNTTGSPMQGFVYDPSGQVAPPGAKPRVTATLWEDEGSLCYQVEAKGVCVARREDNHMINGTKLLNVAGMTRGRRDGILKSEKLRHVVKIGPMHLKGVWIPFERALDFANKEKITDLLYPLFVHNIGGLLYHPANQNRTQLVVQESQHRRMEGPSSGPQRTTPTAPQHSNLHHQALQTPMSSHMPQPSSVGGGSRPGLERANTFPTPPASASSLMGVTNQNSSYEWGGSVPHSQPLSIDTTLSNQRSMPTTPATTPPGNNMHSMPPYQAQSGYESKPYYSAAPQSHSQYAPQTPMTQSGISSYGQSLPTMNSYLKSEMAPPTGRTGDHESSDLKNHRYAQGSGSDRYGQDASDESVQDQESEYLQDQGSSYNNRGAYTYTANTAGSALGGEHAQLTPEMTGSPQQNVSGRMTPRTSISGPAPHWASGYNTPPRPPLAPSLYNAVSDTRGTPANGASDPYSMPSTSNPVYSTTMNGSMGSGSKRMRDDDDVIRADPAGEFESKRRKTITENPLGGPLGGAPLLQPMKTGGPMARRR
ncbi:Cell pattern formation-associated stuA-like protein [Penicillium ucsense]|uniref:Cell pattern formation-associated protein STUA n=1 Tax=Penicillium ucsense TaxID=2839758 RepID=A0A8J8W9M6_9EURO|nr:Cell pattern formation-associated stuA-like protein [Penicillium ucsense]KAF7736530.1 Cell pattern formation-associated stuA-like protein [Penicillium ucsense]